MSKLIDYAGLTEFYNKFKDEITAPEIVDLWFQESSWSDNDKNINITALSKFETKWKNLHGTGNKVAYFLGRFSNGMGADAVSMLFVKKYSEYVAISNIKLGDDNDIFDTVTHLYRYALKNTGEITMNEVIYANKQDKLISGTNIKTINNQSLLGSGNIEISAPSITVDTTMSNTSTNPVQNKVIKAYIDGLVGNVAA